MSLAARIEKLEADQTARPSRDYLDTWRALYLIYEHHPPTPAEAARLRYVDPAAGHSIERLLAVSVETGITPSDKSRFDYSHASATS